MANRLARLVYRMLRFGTEYVDKRHGLLRIAIRQQEILRLHKTTQRLGLQLVDPARSQT